MMKGPMTAQAAYAPDVPPQQGRAVTQEVEQQTILLGQLNHIVEKLTQELGMVLRPAPITVTPDAKPSGKCILADALAGNTYLMQQATSDLLSILERLEL